MSDNFDKTKVAALQAVVVNVKRLLQDARLLQEGGSAGTALSLAILAFEEAGKGHMIEHNWQTPKHVRSQHSYRHFIAYLVLQVSLAQKYGLDVKSAQSQIASRHKALNLKPFNKQPLPPMPRDLREALHAELLPQIERMTDDQQSVFAIELRWLSKIGELVYPGDLEKIRQSGLYLDTDAKLAVISAPSSVTRIEAERWIWAATRVLNLLENGVYSQAYSPLAELMTAANAGDEEAVSLLKAATSFASTTIDD